MNYPLVIVKFRDATHGIDEAIRRCKQYLEADADMVFIDAIATRKDIEQAVKSVDGLLSVNLMDGVTGVRTELIPLPELAMMGVARVSIPVASVKSRNNSSSVS